MAKKVCIDAGHFGKYNRSNVYPSYYESDMNWKLHLLLKKELEAYGFDVITTRDNKDVDLDLHKRG
jgi:N-acetylmuramoyl-L-alanine amidase